MGIYQKDKLKFYADDFYYQNIRNNLITAFSTSFQILKYGVSFEYSWLLYI